MGGRRRRVPRVPRGSRPGRRAIGDGGRTLRDEHRTVELGTGGTAYQRSINDITAAAIKNDLTAWSNVMGYAAMKGWCAGNPLRLFDRGKIVGSDADHLNPPTDAEVARLIDETAGWSTDMAVLVRWLRETGMRLAEALHIHREDVHPDGQTATLRRGVKGNWKGGLKVRTINLGRAAALLDGMPCRERLFAGLHADSAVVSTHYGQWRRQCQGRENRAARAEGRPPVLLREFRLHDLRHAFAIAPLIDDPTCLYRLSEHLGHTSVKTTEMYTRFLKGDGAQRRYRRDRALLGSLPPADEPGQTPAQRAVA